MTSLVFTKQGESNVKLSFGIMALVFSSTSWGFSGDGMPFKYISSCELDLNGDQKADKALLIEGLNGRELLALLSKAKGYDTHVVVTGKENMFLTCKIGNEVKETIAGGGKGRVYKTPGAYLELIKPESSAAAFFWSKGSFQEVWTTDWPFIFDQFIGQETLAILNSRWTRIIWFLDTLLLRT